MAIQMLDIFKSDFRLQKYISGRYAFLATDSSRAGNINHFLPTVNPELSLCLAGTGIVASIPLIFFTIAAVNLPMNVLGFCQYISPILTLLLGILFFNERFGWGGVELHFDVEKGVIGRAQIFSDSLDPAPLDALAERLVGVPYRPEAMAALLHSLMGDFPAAETTLRKDD